MTTPLLSGFLLFNTYRLLMNFIIAHIIKVASWLPNKYQKSEGLHQEE